MVIGATGFPGVSGLIEPRQGIILGKSAASMRDKSLTKPIFGHIAARRLQ
jgi:hypothetical protein